MQDMAVDSGHRRADAHDGPKAGLRSTISWILFQGGRDPYFGLVSGWVFMPYFASVVIGDAVLGQAQISQMAMTVGIITALTVPILGAALDEYGRRKIPLLILTLLAIPLIAALWFVVPGDPRIAQVGLVAVGMILILMSYIETIYGSMLTTAVKADHQSSASGAGFATGSMVLMILAILILWTLLLPGNAQWPFVPDAPILGLSAAEFEPQRAVAPIVALLFFLFAMPLFLFCTDVPRSGKGVAASIMGGIRSLRAMIGDARRYPDLMIYLLSRMLLLDAGYTFLAMGGVYAAGVMQWSAAELALYGVFGALASGVGGLLATVLDGRIGARRAIQVQSILAVAAMITALGQSADHAFFIFRTVPDAWDAPVFRSSSDLLFLLASALVYLFLVGSWASSRTLLANLAPPGKTGTFFALASLSGAATMWLGPALVVVFTRLFDSQMAGFVPLVALLIVGAMVLSIGTSGARHR